jgi:tetratricopeptide (TPR) repeat protein
MDSTYTAPRDTAHGGEKFFVQVEDADRDLSEETDLIDVTAIGLLSGATNTIRLSETLPHSGIFTGMYPSRMYGDNVVFSYRDELTLPGTPVTTHSVTGRVFRGSDGSVRMFSKRFRDSDMAVLVQFRLAECLFEQAKEHRKLKQFERSSKAIDEGKHILEEALKNYPDSSHVAQGEYLLANLYQELATEKKEAKDISGAMPLYTEALARFSTILSTWPDGAFAAKSQYHKALCLEMLGDYARASEEYVKMTYLYPDSELVGDATIRLATYYYKEAKRFDISGKIYQNFQRRFPTHEKAPRALFMSGSCYVKQAEAHQKKYKENNPNAQRLSREASEMYRKAVSSFASVAEKYAETASPVMRAQALYWAGDAALRVGSYEQSYLYLKRTVFEFPETEWARRARGLLLQEERSFKDME